ncbi:MAG: hypothetical protein R3331_02125 [Sulfurospirillaceae bacterium]|nr:hypothetical protein [Sulfurospirillaceae bacterium]
MDLTQASNAVGAQIKEGIIQSGKDIGFKITLGLCIIAIAIYAKK